MERIKQALEKARQERQNVQGGNVVQPLPPSPEATPGSGQALTTAVSLNENILRDHRIIAGLPPGPFTEAYNLLRTRLLQTFKEHGWNTLAITSPGISAGKTLTAINLAISIAREVDYTVLLVDANLQQPGLTDYFGLPRRKGLSDYLTSEVAVSELLIKPGIVDRLVVLPGGQPLANSSEMLTSPKMGRLVEEMKARYPSRIIIFDLPPLLTSSDTLAFAPHVDAALLIVEEGVTQKDELQRAVELLSVTNIVGTVLNKADGKLV
ncbi:MAG: CpsD/CapB family tyrosine-protein kinase [Pseudomonadota bacterium]